MNTPPLTPYPPGQDVPSPPRSGRRLGVWLLIGGLGLVALAVITVIAVIVGFVLTAGDPAGGMGTPPAHPVVVGARVEAGELVVTTGRVCPAGTRFAIDYRGPTGGLGHLDLTANSATDRLNLDSPGPAVTVNERRDPVGGWRDSILAVGTALPDGKPTWSADRLDLTGLTETSAAHPGEFYFGALGWMTPEQAAARDGVDLLTVCTPR